jgi:hypothetical protein
LRAIFLFSSSSLFVVVLVLHAPLLVLQKKVYLTYCRQLRNLLSTKKKLRFCLSLLFAYQANPPHMSRTRWLWQHTPCLVDLSCSPTTCHAYCLVYSISSAPLYFESVVHLQGEGLRATPAKRGEIFLERSWFYDLKAVMT